MSKIQNPVVLIHKRENSDTYAVAITSGSQNYHDALLMASMEPDMVGDDIDTWSKTGYYMAAEIEQLREKMKMAEEKHLHFLGVVDDYDWQRQRLHAAAEKVIRMNRLEALHRTGCADNAENYACVKELRDALTFCEISGGIEKKGLTITLPDITSKVFWSGTGKNEVFHHESYKRWVKEAIERACVIAGIGVEVK
ncbi:hypothetical protein PQY04_004183 [Salmonella enterica]|uniref:Uncharacterized protein n=1 Tax=Salmonella enterica TaxID=28901 RepID=A0A3J0N0P0_SALER|nr:hypothetical protein [Salmonella enterica]ECU4770042.1 hypothetical protein [Salmonella enterica subsp. enterica]EDQ1017950.1 hypothetical protein [Salmonella enterica subsp. houtenae serovar 50:z4,z23:-]EDV3253305.1 hypothetical protein [Salmonella enterica subsp. houtenae]EEE1667663.1 hypothetical protein [Salmonella enterica subsp. houtenae serovar 48:z4,z32:-]HAE7876069.1 hypothetical protein [Salmonella enterica subsp. enterica serovar 1,9,12:-:-]